MSVIVYSTTTCPFCVKAEEYLDSKGVKYEIVDVSKDREKAMFLVKKTRQMSVPVIQINDQFIIGYNVPEIDRILAEEKII